LFGAKRVSKDSTRVEAYGTIDELNSFIGVAISTLNDPRLIEELLWVQGRLFVAGADLASDFTPAEVRDDQKDRIPRISAQDTLRLEKMIDGLLEGLPRLSRFILPGGGTASSNLHVARSVCRRAERSVVALARVETVNPELLPFLNRLSTLLFNLARTANLIEGKEERVWENSS
jgi:cob(I)alamin adenosyltransferase